MSGFSLRFPLFLAREGFQVEVYVGPMLELVLGGVLERSWGDLGRFLGGLPDAFRTAFRFQRRPKTSPRWFLDTSQTVQVQDGARTAQGAAKIFSRWLQGAPQTAHDGPQIDENP